MAPFKKLPLWKRLKFRVQDAIERKTRTLKVSYRLKFDPEFRARVDMGQPLIEIAQAGDRFKAGWPEFQKLRWQARDIMEKKSNPNAYNDLVEDVMESNMRGRITWMADWSPTKKAAATIYSELTLAGIEVPSDRLKYLGLSAEDVTAINGLLKSYQ